MRIDRNPAFETEVKAEILPTLKAKAEEVKTRTVAIAPRGPTGFYRRSIDVIGLIVRTRDFAGHMVEWGSKNNAPYAPLRRAALAAGLRLVESPKPK